MADYMTISSKHASWKEFYLSKEKETKLFPEEPMDFENSLSSRGAIDPFSAFLNDSIVLPTLAYLLEL